MALQTRPNTQGARLIATVVAGGGLTLTELSANDQETAREGEVLEPTTAVGKDVLRGRTTGTAESRATGVDEAGAGKATFSKPRQCFGFWWRSKEFVSWIKCCVVSGAMHLRKARRPSVNPCTGSLRANTAGAVLGLLSAVDSRIGSKQQKHRTT